MSFKATPGKSKRVQLVEDLKFVDNGQRRGMIREV